ncbi:hypothetical protein QVD17_21045 [Tagetes erecta]|uniref:UDP-glucuronate decarboxylase n=1 Tax=Tagetes erecta TaxID=13708 RepID=A0AAD8KMB5_TARER|nr:hypothetical protein QVD17_21045 [Tagetes erecta]
MHIQSQPPTIGYTSPVYKFFGLLNSGGKISLVLKWKGMRIVVTDGAGFIGSHLVDRLIARGGDRGGATSKVVIENLKVVADRLGLRQTNPRDYFVNHVRDEEKWRMIQATYLAWGSKGVRPSRPYMALP